MNAKMFIAPAVGLVLMFGMIFVSNSQVKSAQETLSEKENTLYDLQNELDIKLITEDEVEKKLIKDTTGLDTARVERDDKIAEELISDIFTWSSHEEYEKDRQRIASECNVPTDSYMLTTLFPEDTSVVDTDGTVYNYIDQFGRNSKFETMETYVSNIDTATYSYYAFVVFSSSDKEGNEATGKVVLTYDIDADENISNIMGYTLS